MSYGDACRNRPRTPSARWRAFARTQPPNDRRWRRERPPAGAFGRVAPVARWPGRTMQPSVSVSMCCISTRAGLLVAHHRFLWYQCLKTRQAQGGQQAADGGDASLLDTGNGTQGHARAAQFLDAGLRLAIDSRALLARSRTAIHMAGLAQHPDRPRHPRADSGRHDRRHQSRRTNPFNQQLAPCKPGSAVFMTVHPVASPGLLKRRELQCPRTFRVNGLLKHHG